jgi:hypothetical protein
MKGEFALLRGAFGISIAISVLGLFVGSESEARVEPARPPAAPVVAQPAPTPQLSAEEEYLLQRCGPTTNAQDHVKCRSKAMAEMRRAQQRAKRVHHKDRPASAGAGRPQSPDSDKAFELDEYLLPEHRAPTRRTTTQPETLDPPQ